MRRKVLSLVLALCMVMSLLPMTAFAVGTESAKPVFNGESDKAGFDANGNYVLVLADTVTTYTDSTAFKIYTSYTSAEDNEEATGITVTFDSENNTLTLSRGEDATGKWNASYFITADEDGEGSEKEVSAASDEITVQDQSTATIAAVTVKSDAENPALAVTAAKDMNGTALAGDVKVTVTDTTSDTNVEKITVGENTVTFTDGSASIPLGTLSEDVVGAHTLSVQIAGVTEAVSASLTVQSVKQTITATLKKDASTDVAGTDITKVYDGTDVFAAEKYASWDVAFENEEGEAITGLTKGTDYSITSIKFADAKAGNGKVATATVELKKTDKTANYTLDSAELTISGASITKAPLTIKADDTTVADKVYDGETAATVNVAFEGLVNNETLTAGTDYTVSANFADKNAGDTKNVTGTVALQSTDKANNYELSNGALTGITGKISPVELKNVSVNFEIGSAGGDGSITENTTLQAVVTAEGVVDGEELTYNYAWTVNGQDRSEESDTYTVGDSGTDSGDVKVVVTLKDPSTGVNANYKWPTTEVSKSAEIGSIAIAASAFAEGVTISKAYDGTTAYTFDTAPTVKFVQAGTSTAVDNVVCNIESVTFEDADVGNSKTVTVVVSLGDNGTNNYSLTNNTFTTTGAITKVTIEESNVSLSAASFEYTGEDITPDVTVTVGGKTLVKDTDYTLTYASNKNVGDSATVTVAGANNYDGSVVKTFAITKATPTGTPDYAKTGLTAGTSTLADANLAVGTITPSAGTIKWVDAEGNALDTATKIVAGTAYKWLFTPTDTNYNTLEGTITLVASGGSTGGGNGGTTTPPVEPDPGPVDPPAGEDVTVEAPDGVVDDATANDMVNDAVENNSANVTVKSDSDTVELPASAIADLASKTDAALTVDTPLANVTIPNESLPQLGASSGTVAVKTTMNDDNSVTVDVQRNGTTVETLSGGIKVNVPAESTTSGTVAVLVNPDGTETIIPKSVVNGTEVAVLVDGSATIKIVDNSKQFDDMGSHWAKNAAAFTSSRNLFKGVSDTQFAADVAMSRAMLATVLYRMENEPSVSGGSFADVPADSYYADAAAWAAGKGIVTGDGTGFNGNRDITREEMAVMFYRYVQTINGNKGTLGNYSHMTDANQVSSWASEAMRWAVGSGVMKGTDTGALNPKGSATRGEVSQMVMNFVQLITK